MKDIFERIKENPGPLGQFADYGEGYFIFPRLRRPNWSEKRSSKEKK